MVDVIIPIIRNEIYFLGFQQLEQELESIKTATPNGPSSDEPDTATNRATPPANEEEVTQLKEEKAELVQTVQDLEKKLDDLKVKNNVSAVPNT